MKDKFLFITTVPNSLNFYKGQVQVLKKKYHLMAASSPGEKLRIFGQRENIPTYPVAMKREIAPFRDCISLLKLLILIGKLRPKIVHASTPKAGLLGMIAAYINRTPIRIYFIQGLRYEGAKGWKKKFLKAMERLSCRLATHVFTVSHGTKKTLKKDRIYRKKIHIIWNGSVNGIDIGHFDRQQTPYPKIDGQRIPEGSFIFGYVGRLVGDKGINELVEAFTNLHQYNPHIRLLMVGDFEKVLDPLHPKTTALIHNHPGILFMGFQKDVKPFYKQMDVFVFPSYREGFGMVVMEAAAMQTAVICSNISGCNEIIQDGYSGILIPPKSTKALLAAMQCLLNSPNLVKKYASNARKSVAKKYDQHTLWEYSLKAYTELSSTKAS